MGVQRLGERGLRTGPGRGAGSPGRRREGSGRSGSSDGGRAVGPGAGGPGGPVSGRSLAGGSRRAHYSHTVPSAGAVAMPESRSVFEAAEDPELLHGLTLVTGVAADAGAAGLAPESHGAWGSVGTGREVT